MKVLLTGANGFVGSHVLDRLLESGHEVAIMLRRTSNTRFIEGQLGHVEVRYGDLDSPPSLREAFSGAEVAIHCAARTKAVRRADYYAANARGALHVAEACNACADTLRQLVLISSLAASGPGTVESPARADGPARPVSAYGKSKLQGEEHVRQCCRVPWTILRPAAVYGPRDGDFLLVFRAAGRRVVPVVGSSKALNLVYVGDVADAIVGSVGCEAGLGGTYHVAHATPCTQGDLIRAVAAALGRRPFVLPLPGSVLYPACVARGFWARVTGRPGILNMDKIPELRAPGWVCDTGGAERDLAFVAATALEEGLRRTAQWYREAGWR